jgi:ParB-like chromosome segregation protein Spo0J
VGGHFRGDGGTARHLIAGGRRLAAALLLGWTHLEARSMGDLSEVERAELELEENIRRKELTQLELSKELVRKAVQLAPILEERRISTASVEIDRRGRKAAHGTAKVDIAAALGVGTTTLVRAEQHVAAVEKYPELNIVGMTQQGAITTAKNLDALPAPEREVQREAIRQHDMAVMAVLGEVPPLPTDMREWPAVEAGQAWVKLLQRLDVFT